MGIELIDKKFMLFEEHEDGTTSLTINNGEGGPDQSFIIPLTFDALFDLIPEQAKEETHKVVEENLVAIPNDAEQAGGRW